VAFYPRDAERHGELELFIKKVAIVVAIAILLALLWVVRDVLVLVFIAAVLAAGISPAVHRVRVLGRYYLHRNIARGTAVMTVYLPFLIGGLLLVAFLAPRMIVETRDLGEQLPQLLEKNVLTPLERFIPMAGVRDYLARGVSVSTSSVLLYVKSAATIVASVVAVLFMIVYMLIDAHRLRNLILLLYPAEVRAERRRTMSRMANRMTSWLSGQLILSAIMGVATFVLLLVLRIPYALPLAILAMVGEMVPVIGPIVGTAPSLAIALLHSRWQFWSVLVMVLLFQKLENLFVAPRVMARKVEISPLAAFIAFMAGATLLGIVGALMAIPMAAIAKVTFEEVFVARRERRLDMERAGTLRRKV
jgi:predicted PurR-regulated permease PerM